MKMKNLALVFLVLISCFGISKIKAQENNNESRSFSEWLVETPWEIGFGGAIIKDNNANMQNADFSFLKYTYYPARFTAEKDLKIKGLSMQFAFGSTSINPHGFSQLDVGFHYAFNTLIGKSNLFDPYAGLGFGLTHRDNDYLKNTTIYDHSFQSGFNVDFGNKFWLTKIMAVNLGGQAKFAKDPYLQANIGLVFKIRPAQKVLKPKSQEAKDALKHLRGIINK